MNSVQFKLLMDWLLQYRVTLTWWTAAALLRRAAFILQSSVDSCILCILTVGNTKLDSKCSFSYTALVPWNTLPKDSFLSQLLPSDQH